MFKKKNDENAVQTDTVVKSSSSSSQLPILIFLIGLFLIVTGFMIQIGFIGGGEEAVPTQEATETETTTEEEKTENTNQNVIKNGVAFVVDPTITYSLEDGTYSISATAITSTCDTATSVCGFDTDVVTLSVKDSSGVETPVSLTVAKPSMAVGNYTYSITKWDDGKVELTVVGATNDSDNTSGTTTNGTNGSTTNGTSEDGTVTSGVGSKDNTKNTQ